MFLKVFLINLKDFSDKKDIQEFYEYLGAYEKKKALNLTNDQSLRQTIFSYALLRNQVSKYLECDSKKLEIVENDYGKPYFKNLKNFCFNISHSENLIALAICDKNIGIDIEHMTKDRTIVAKRFFENDEYGDIITNKKTKPNLFYDYWTAKESVSKLLGKGLHINLVDIKLKRKGDIFTLNNDICSKEIFIHQFNIDDYKLSVASFKNYFDINLTKIC